MSEVRLVTITVEELESLVREAVTGALAESATDAPALLDRESLARSLGCTTSHVDTLRKQGMPVVWLGQAPRFELSAVLEWLRGRSA
jgi:hypothetical protein